MTSTIKNFQYLEQKYNVSFEELVSIGLNLGGVSTTLNLDRVRFELRLHKDQSLLFTTENNPLSIYSIKNDKLFFKNDFLFDISNLQEDTCEIFYTRKNGKVLCFNPNNRSSCIGCRFCYQPMSNDKQNISVSMIKTAFENWIKLNNLKDLSHLEQVAVVTGCFKNEQMTIGYLTELRNILLSFDFTKEILFFGTISNIQNIEQLSQIKPLQLCFTIECFENRDFLLKKSKNLELNSISELMKKSLEQGIKTTFSYIVGLDAFDVFKTYTLQFKDCVNSFPIFSLFQANKDRIKHKHKEALDIEYYLNCRQYIEEIFKHTNLLPNSWNNYRSLWRTCYNGKNIIDDK